MEFYLKDSKATEKLGFLLGKAAFDGAVFCLTGELGAGKTLLAGGLASALGVTDAVTSPTFTLLNIYEGARLELRHFDLYRLSRSEELDDIGFDEYAGGEGVTVIEWADLFKERLPEAYLSVDLRREGEGRRAVISAVGAGYAELMEEVAQHADFSA